MNPTESSKGLRDHEKQNVINTLYSERCSCVVRNGDHIRLFRERGIKDLYGLLNNEPQLLRGAFIADKVVGKGAAALMILGGAAEIFADVISHPALELLNRCRVKVSYTLAVPRLVDRTRSGPCPLEVLCRDLLSPEECKEKIDYFMQTIRQ